MDANTGLFQGMPHKSADDGRQASIDRSEDMLQSPDHVAFALAATATGLWTFHHGDTAVACDHRALSLIGASGTGQVPLSIFLGAIHDDKVAALEAILTGSDDAAPGTQDFELRIRRLDNSEERWIAVRAQRHPLTGDVIGTARDITDVKRNDLHVHMLMREVTHRSKNLLAIIQAMARQTVKHSLSATDFESRFSARLRGLSFSHELLASQDWRGASLTALAEGHLSSLRERHGQRVQIAGPIVFVRPEAAQNIGLALNELGSNAQQFGALAGDAGTVRLEWHIDADDRAPHALHMLWTESGAARDVQPPLHQGFGHKVMERVVARALDAVVTMTYAPTGLRWSLRIPLSHIASDKTTR